MRAVITLARPRPPCENRPVSRTHLFSAVPLLFATAISVSTLLPFALDAFASDPETRIEDAYKWLFQAASGGEHAVPDEESARAWLRKEWASLGETAPGEPLLVPLRPDGELVRLNLRPYRDRGGKPDDLTTAFLESSRTFGPDPALFLESWNALGELLAARPLGPLNRAEWGRLDADMRVRGYPAVHHSAVFARTRRPAYRVLTCDEASRLLRTAPPACAPSGGPP